MSNPETCQTCRYWQPDLGRKGEYPKPIGLCRINPPSSTADPFPITALHDWCGRYTQGRPLRLYVGLITHEYGQHTETSVVGLYRDEEDAAEAVREELRIESVPGAVVATPGTSSALVIYFRVVSDDSGIHRLEHIDCDVDDPDQEPPDWDSCGEVFSTEVK